MLKNTDSFNMDILDIAITRLLQNEYSMSMLLAKDTCINIINISIYIEDITNCIIILFVGQLCLLKGLLCVGRFDLIVTLITFISQSSPTEISSKQ